MSRLLKSWRLFMGFCTSRVGICLISVAATCTAIYVLGEIQTRRETRRLSIETDRGIEGAAFYLALEFDENQTVSTRTKLRADKDYVWVGYVRNKSESITYGNVRLRAGIHILDKHGVEVRMGYAVEKQATPSGDLGPYGTGKATLRVPEAEIKRAAKTGQIYTVGVDVLAVCPNGQLYDSSSHRDFSIGR